MAIELVTGTKNGLREVAPDMIIRGSALTNQVISGTQVISGSTPAREEEDEPSLIRLEIPHGEGLAVYMGIAWSLALEAGVAAIGYAIFQLWKVF
jgi:hypothetical protein